MPAPSAKTSDVAQIIPERVSDPGADFTEATNPTKVQVTSIIGQIVVDVQAHAGVNVDATLVGLATLTVATGVAAQVELAFTDDLAGDKASKYEQLYGLYKDRLDTLKTAQNQINHSGAIGQGEPQSAAFTVPDTTQSGFPMTTWAQRF